jgi:hypothetical protein
MDDNTAIIYAVGLLIFGLILVVAGLILRRRYDQRGKDDGTTKTQ